MRPAGIGQSVAVEPVPSWPLAARAGLGPPPGIAPDVVDPERPGAPLGAWVRAARWRSAPRRPSERSRLIAHLTRWAVHVTLVDDVVTAFPAVLSLGAAEIPSATGQTTPARPAQWTVQLHLYCAPAASLRIGRRPLTSRNIFVDDAAHQGVQSVARQSSASRRKSPDGPRLSPQSSRWHCPCTVWPRVARGERSPRGPGAGDGRISEPPRSLGHEVRALGSFPCLNSLAVLILIQDEKPRRPVSAR